MSSFPSPSARGWLYPADSPLRQVAYHSIQGENRRLASRLAKIKTRNRPFYKQGGKRTKKKRGSLHYITRQKEMDRINRENDFLHSQIEKISCRKSRYLASPTLNFPKLPSLQNMSESTIGPQGSAISYHRAVAAQRRKKRQEAKERKERKTLASSAGRLERGNRNIKCMYRQTHKLGVVEAVVSMYRFDRDASRIIVEAYVPAKAKSFKKEIGVNEMISLMSDEEKRRLDTESSMLTKMQSMQMMRALCSILVTKLSFFVADNELHFLVSCARRDRSALVNAEKRSRLRKEGVVIIDGKTARVDDMSSTFSFLDAKTASKGFLFRRHASLVESARAQNLLEVENDDDMFSLDGCENDEDPLFENSRHIRKEFIRLGVLPKYGDMTLVASCSYNTDGTNAVLSIKRAAAELPPEEDGDVVGFLDSDGFDVIGEEDFFHVVDGMVSSQVILDVVKEDGWSTENRTKLRNELKSALLDRLHMMTS